MLLGFRNRDEVLGRAQRAGVMVDWERPGFARTPTIAIRQFGKIGSVFRFGNIFRFRCEFKFGVRFRFTNRTES